MIMRFISIMILSTVLSLGNFIQGIAQKNIVYNEIRSLIQSGEYHKAKHTIETALENNRDDADLFFLLGYTNLKLVDEVSIFKKRRYAGEGRKALENAIALDPHHTKAHKELSDFYLYAPSIVGGDRGKAVQLIDQIQPFDPYHFYIIKGDFYVNDGNLKESLNYFQIVKQEYPDSLLPKLKVGFYLREMGKFEESISIFKEALKTDSTYYLSYYHIGAAGLEGGIKTEESISNFRKYIAYAVQVDSQYVEHAWYRIGQLYEVQGNSLAAKKSYQKSIKYNSEYGPALNRIEKLN